MNNSTLVKQLSLTLCSATMLLLASKFNPAVAARLTFDVTGTVTNLTGAGESLESLRGSNLGDTVTGSYSFDDEVTIAPNLSPLLSFSLDFLSGEVASLDFFQQGTINLETGAIRLPDPSLDFPIFAGFSTINNRFAYSVRNTAIEGTFITQPAKSVPESSVIFSLLAIGIYFITTNRGDSKLP